MEITADGKGRSGRKRILLVDDDRIFRDEFVECFGEYGFVQASGAREALRALKRPNELGLVIMEIRLPGMDGLSLLEKINEGAFGVGTIVLTGYGSKEAALRALRGKADDFLEKPFDPAKVRAAIEKALSAREDGSGAGAIERVKRFLRRNSYRKVSLGSAADMVGLSPKYLSRVFLEHEGAGFNEYKLRLKMSAAGSLLKDTTYNVSQISGKLGYRNAESFIRQFKKLSGLTPSAYRKRSRGGARIRGPAALARTGPGKKVSKKRNGEITSPAGSRYHSHPGERRI